MKAKDEQKDDQIVERLLKVRSSVRELAKAPAASKNAVLARMIELLTQKQSELLQANHTDVQNLSNASSAFKDRLSLNAGRLQQMQDSLRDVMNLPDPVGEIIEDQTLADGLRLRRVRSPLGVILMIFESRPNVITEAFSLAFKAGNAMIMRGGSESSHTAAVLYELWSQSMRENGLPVDLLWGITDPDRALSQRLMKENRYIDVLVPRGGEGLIRYVTENSTLPIIKNDRGLCHVYVHQDADLNMACEIVTNGKTQRPGVCNSVETLLVHSRIKDAFLPMVYDRMSAFQVEWHGCPETLQVLSGRERVKSATVADWDTEYLDFKINCRIVGSQEEAEQHIQYHGSGHSEAIITRSEPAARRFQSTIDAAAVYWNASTRFTDGFQFGLGGELGISTQKLHVRGPVGLRELTSSRWLIDGNGQVRQ